MEKLPSAFQPGDKVGLQMLIDLMGEARDAKVNAVNFSNSKVKYNIEVPVDDGYFRLANIDSAFLHAPVDNGFQYNDKVAVETRRHCDDYKKIEKKDTPFNHAGWHNSDDFPIAKEGKGSYASVDVLCDVNGKRKEFRVGWYDFDDKEWRFHDDDRSWLEEEHLKWSYIPIS